MKQREIETPVQQCKWRLQDIDADICLSMCRR